MNDLNQFVRELSELTEEVIDNNEWRVVVVAHHYDREPTIYRSPQHVLEVVFEEREKDSGGVYWVAKMPFFGFFAYGESKKEAGVLVLSALAHIAEAREKRSREAK